MAPCPQQRVSLASPLTLGLVLLVIGAANAEGELQRSTLQALPTYSSTRSQDCTYTSFPLHLSCHLSPLGLEVKVDYKLEHLGATFCTCHGGLIHTP